MREGVGEEGAEIGEGVGDGVAEIDYISFMVELILEGKCEIGTIAALFLNLLVLVVVHFCSISDPTYFPPLMLHH